MNSNERMSKYKIFTISGMIFRIFG